MQKRCKKKHKYECATVNVRSPNWETNCASKQPMRPQEFCKCVKYKPPPPPTCINSYITKKKRKKPKLKVDANAQIIVGKQPSKIGTESNTEYPSTNSNVTTSVSNVKNTSKSNTNYSATSYDRSTTKNSSATNASPQSASASTSDKSNASPQSGSASTSDKSNSNDTQDQEVCLENFVCQRKQVKYIDYKGFEKRRRHRMDYLTGPPLPIICDTTPNYYVKVDAQKTTCAFYCNYLNCKLWKMHLPKPPILLGACIHHLHCFVNEDDYLYKYLKLRENLAAQQKKRAKQK